MLTWIAVLLSFLLALGGTLPGVPVELGDSGLSVEIPNGVTTLRRGVRLSNRAQKLLDITNSEAQLYLESGDYYLYLADPASSSEIFISVIPSQIAQIGGDLALYGPKELEHLMTAAQQENESSGWVQDSEATIRENERQRYLVHTMHFEGEQGMANREMMTVWQGKEIYIDLYSGTGKITEDMARLQDKLVDTLRYDSGLTAQRLVNLLWQIGLLGGIWMRSVGLMLALYLLLGQRKEKIT